MLARRRIAPGGDKPARSGALLIASAAAKPLAADLCPTAATALVGDGASSGPSHLNGGVRSWALLESISATAAARRFKHDTPAQSWGHASLLPLEARGFMRIGFAR